jgi:hypothetical protein
MTNYQKQKARARQQAIERQLDFNNHGCFYSELCYYAEYFEKLGKRYGLIKEFRENGII